MSSFLIQETEYGCFYGGCYDYSEFGIPHYISFGSDYDAEWYYLLEHALKDVQFILEHSKWKEEELRIYIADEDKTLTIEEVRRILKNGNDSC